MKNNASFSVVALAFILGLGVLYLSVLDSQKVPAWIFANKVPYNETLTRLGIIELEEQDISRFHGLIEAIRESDPIRPVGISNRKGKIIIDLLGGEDTDVARARVIDVVYCYSVKLDGEYYNICIVFIEERERAMLSGAFWVAGIQPH